jgi:hypothetical protein
MGNELENHKTQSPGSKRATGRNGKLFLIDFLDLFEI